MTVVPLDKVRDLGVILDRRLSIKAHVANVVRSSFYQLRQLWCIRRSLTTDSRRTRATAFVANRVDYCNAVLYGTSAVVIRRLQMVLNGNAVARLIVGLDKYEHITTVLHSSQCPPLAACASENTVQNCCTDFWLCQRHRACLLQQHCLHSRRQSWPYWSPLGWAWWSVRSTNQNN